MTGDAPTISFVVPCHNEEGNLRPLLAALHVAVAPLRLTHEVVIVDDASTDGSWALLKELAAADPRLRAQRFAANCGQSAAMFAGLKAARQRRPTAVVNPPPGLDSRIPDRPGFPPRDAVGRGVWTLL